VGELRDWLRRALWTKFVSGSGQQAASADDALRDQRGQPRQHPPDLNRLPTPFPAAGAGVSIVKRRGDAPHTRYAARLELFDSRRPQVGGPRVGARCPEVRGGVAGLGLFACVWALQWCPIRVPTEKRQVPAFLSGWAETAERHFKNKRIRRSISCTGAEGRDEGQPKPSYSRARSAADR
jgi:hypothetical protein